eukprot:c13368_g1_i1 orf=75-821(+)
MGSHHHHRQHQQGPCHRCGRSGHLARDCSLHTCFRCNGRGHMAWECVEGVICGKCGEKGHLQRNCKNISCHKCGKKGHIARFCNDPFAKAAEVEKHERQQALASARTPVLSFPATEERSGGIATRGTGRTVPHKDMRGPWDGLGVNRRDTGSHEEQQGDKTNVLGFQDTVSLSSARKRQAPSSIQNVVSRRLKIVGVKPDNDCQKIAASTGSSKEVERSGISHWEGLVGYGSEDSDIEPLKCTSSNSP